MSKDSLGDRQKAYEDSFRQYLPVRLPVIVRVDGCHFHTYTKNCKRPVDPGLVECMNLTAMELCKTMQGCQLAYVQSDEISLLLTNFQTVDTQSWFENNLQKMVSVAASIAGVTFTTNSEEIWGYGSDMDDYPIQKPAYFDARAFVLPKEEVCNYFLWRQLDATRNSVQMLARSIYSHRQLEGKNNSQLQEMIFNAGTNWDKCPIPQKRGRCIVKTKTEREAFNPKTKETVKALRSEWVVDNEIPIFSQDRRYIDKFLFPKEVLESWDLIANELTP